MKRLKIITAITLVLVTLTFLPGCIGQEEEKATLKIGVIGPMTYPQGKHHRYGAEMACDEINAQGGVLGHQLELVVADSEEVERVNTLPLERMLTEHNISVIVGGFRTEAVIAMQEVAMEHKTLFLGTGAATPVLCQNVLDNYEKFKYWFRVTPINSTMLGKVDFTGLAVVAANLRAALGIETPKVAMLAEAAVWADGIVAAAPVVLPTLGMEVIDAMPTTPEIDAWRPSATATDVDAELKAIEAAGAHIIFTTLSGPVGITYAKRWGELQIPAASVGINVEAQKLGFWDATGGKGNYDTTMNTYARTAITELTIPWYEEFEEKFGEWPTYNAGSYEAIHVWANAVERAGTVDPEKVIPELEKTGKVGGKQKFRDADEGVGTAGKIVFTQSHDVTFGPGFVIGIFTQWQDGKLECVWPFGEMSGVSWPNLATAAYKIPPWVIEQWT
ncbi:MAG: ABC transporter substrate-binding protein [Candidatus Heimdallarchaeota archaeon]